MSQKERKDIRLHSFLKKQIYSILAVFTKLKPNVFMKNLLHVSSPMYIRHTMYNLKSLVFLKIPYYLCIVKAHQQALLIFSKLENSYHLTSSEIKMSLLKNCTYLWTFDCPLHT